MGGNGKSLGAPLIPGLIDNQDLLPVEMNIAKFSSFIFTPSHARNDVLARVKTWVIDINGKKALAKILVEPVDRQILNTFDYRTYLTLQKLWWERPRDPAEGWTAIRLRELARIMKLGWGKKQLLLLKRSLRSLRKVPITWQYSFFDKDAGRHHLFEEPINLLSKLRIYESRNLRSRSDGYEGVSYFRFNEQIEKNLLRQHTKPILVDVVMEIRGEIALTLYAFLDVVMADKFAWQRRAGRLLEEDLSVRGKYVWPSERLRLIRRAIEELEGKPISTGLLQLAMVKTKDDKDYKLIVRKRPTRSLPIEGADPKQLDLVEQILEFTNDRHSRPYYEKMVRCLPETLVYCALSETKDAEYHGQIRTSRARFFTTVLKRLARERGRPPNGDSVFSQ
ncbi:hypothetical protein [Candidatus Manganitrophus noduliformans]|uniref:Replication initiator protein A n=1 Tax=Candidatus Manganitrophus noduliformans TaxID=2606439 RepID=A0A7X6DMV9_9BACT|nr:hypothetical protein [Candidatus Manganitrophus noduliformans]NKE70152.1 hypothetical protein [Candidatus Manganitrophus noduliformans]